MGMSKKKFIEWEDKLIMREELDDFLCEAQADEHGIHQPVVESHNLIPF